MTVVTLCAIVAPAGTVAAFWLGLRLLGRARWFDAPFVFVLAIVCLYTLISPSLAVVSRSLPAATRRSTQYLLFELLSWILLIVPMVFVYAAVRRSAGADDETPPPFKWVSSGPVILASLVTLVLKLVISSVYGLWRLRIGEVVAERVTSVPAIPYALLRASVELQNPLLVLSVAVVAADRRASVRRLGWIVIAVGVVVQGVMAILNSRFAVLYLAFALGLGYLIVRRPPALFGRRVVRRAAVAALVAYALGVLALGTRGPQEGIASLSVVADNQGFNRFNCADLVAQTGLLTLADDPRIGIWDGYVWTFRRFVDPQGFDAFRRGLHTTAKSHMTDEYLHLPQADYFSCMATDAVGAFGPLGLMVLGVVLGGVVGLAARLLASGSAVRVVVGLFVTFMAINVDQEFAALLFTWPLRLPGLVVLVVVANFAVAGGRRRARAAITWSEAPIGAPG